MKPTASAVWFALAMTMAAGADDPKAAPLDGAKQQLQQLQKDESAAKSGAGDSGLKGALPELKTTLQGREALPSTALNPNQNSKDQERKREAKKNWLVDGYDRLDPKGSNAKTDGRAVAEGTETDDKEPEPGDANYLIKLYEKQGNSREATVPQDKQTGGKAGHPPPADPLAPFLQGWLANSPVRDAALSTIPRNDGGGGIATDPVSGPVTTEVIATPSSGGGSLLPNSGPATAADNPYLLALTLPQLSGISSGNPPSPSIGSFESLPNGPVAKPTLNGPADSLAPPARTDTHKPPPSPADEDKKYFPQLKRF